MYNLRRLAVADDVPAAGREKLCDKTAAMVPITPCRVTRITQYGKWSCDLRERDQASSEYVLHFAFSTISAMFFAKVPVSVSRCSIRRACYALVKSSGRSSMPGRTVGLALNSANFSWCFRICFYRLRTALGLLALSALSSTTGCGQPRVAATRAIRPPEPKPKASAGS